MIVVILELIAITVFLIHLIKYMALNGRPLLGVLKCALRGYHQPYNYQYLGAFRCRDCLLTGSHLGEFGDSGSGYVSHMKSGPDEKGYFTREER